MEKESKSLTEEDLDELLEQQWSKQDEIHKSCKIKERKKYYKP
jgi:hypothetical protein